MTIPAWITEIERRVEADLLALVKGLDVEGCGLDDTAQIAAALKRCGESAGLGVDEASKQAAALMGKARRYAGERVTISRSFPTRRTDWQHDDLLAEVMPALLDEARKRLAALGYSDDDWPGLAVNLAIVLRDVLTPSWKLGDEAMPAVIDEDTGEVVDPPRDATGLRRHVDPDEWCRRATSETFDVRAQR